MHVSTPWREALRTVIKKLKGKKKFYYSFPPEIRRKLVCDVYECMSQNLEVVNTYRF
jgi:aspartate carbamoyltransferase regulatory subunit